MTTLQGDIESRLETEKVVWISTLRGDGSPHLTPVWFCYLGGDWWVASPARSVKVRNITADPRVSLALPDGERPVVAEGAATVHRDGADPHVVAAFAAKYDGWTADQDIGYGPMVLIQVKVTRWLMAGTPH